MQVSANDVEDARRADEATQALLLKEGGLSKETLERIDKLAASAEFSFASETVKGYAPRFVKAFTTSLRVATWTFLTGIGVWLLRHYHLLPDAYIAALPGVVIAIIFNTTTNLASTVKSVFQAFVGTTFALATAYLLFHLPDPGEGSVSGVAGPPTCPAVSDSARLLADDSGSEMKDLYEWYCGAFAGLYHPVMPAPACLLAFLLWAIFVVVTLSFNVVMAFKLFALSTALGNYLNFANPNVDTAGMMELRWESNMVVTVVVQLTGSAIAILAMLLPPVTATRSHKAIAARATKVTAELLLYMTNYYCGAAKTLQINVYNSQQTRNREDMATIATDLDAAWWEIFDWGKAGTVRVLMENHLTMLKELDRRISVMQTCVLREGFEKTHTELMREMRGPLLKTVRCINDCLLTCTLAAADGYFAKEELDLIAKQVEAINEAMRELSTHWRRVRGDIQKCLSPDNRAEGFFMLEISTVGRMVVEFAEKVHLPDKRPAVKSYGLNAIKDALMPKKLESPEFRNFILRTWIALMISWWWACLFNQYVSAVPMNVIFMASELPGNAILMNLQNLQASVLGSLAGSVLYRAFHYCSTLTRAAKLGSLFGYELLAVFISKYTKEYATVGTLLAVYGGGKLLMVCDDHTTNGQIWGMNSGEYKSFRFFAYAMVINNLVTFMLKREPAATQCRAKLLEAMDTSFDYMKRYLNNDVAKGLNPIWQETNEITEKVEGLLGEAEALLGPADQEPRFSKGPFKAVLFKELIERIKSMTLNAQVLIRRSQGGDESLMDYMLKCPNFKLVKDDLLETIDDTRRIVQKVANYDGFGAMHSSQFDDLLGKAGMDKLDGLQRLNKDVVGLKMTASSEVSLEYGNLSRFAVVFELLQLYTSDLNAMMSTTVLHM